MLLKTMAVSYIFPNYYLVRMRKLKVNKLMAMAVPKKTRILGSQFLS